MNLKTSNTRSSSLSNYKGGPTRGTKTRKRGREGGKLFSCDLCKCQHQNEATVQDTTTPSGGKLRGSDGNYRECSGGSIRVECESLNGLL